MYHYFNNKPEFGIKLCNIVFKSSSLALESSPDLFYNYTLKCLQLF